MALNDLDHILYFKLASAGKWLSIKYVIINVLVVDNCLKFRLWNLMKKIIFQKSVFVLHRQACYDVSTYFVSGLDTKNIRRDKAHKPTTITIMPKE